MKYINSILESLLLLAAFSIVANAQIYVPIPNQLSGPTCPSDPTQCYGYKTRADINNRLGGPIPIAPSYVSKVVTTNTVVTLGVSNYIINAPSFVTMTLPAATGSGATFTFKNLTAHTAAIQPINSNLIDGLSSFAITNSANQAITIADAYTNNWVIIANSNTNLLPLPIPIASGGTGTTNPNLIQGTNVTITGNWPNQTINASGGLASVTTDSTLTGIGTSGSPLGLAVPVVPSSGGTGVSNPVIHEIAIAEGSSPFNFVSCAAGLPFVGNSSADPSCQALNLASSGVTGTLPAINLPATTVNAVTNDTNVTGSIALQNLTLGWTGQLSSTRGGTGVSNPTAHSVAISESSSAFAFLNGGVDTLLAGAGVSADPSFISLLSCSGASNALTYNTSTHAFGCNTSGTVASVGATGGVQVANPTSSPVITIPNNSQYAAGYSGGDFGAKVNAAIAQLPAKGGTVDANGLTGNQTLSTNIVMGSQTQSVTLLLPCGTITRSLGIQILVYNGSHIIGGGNDANSRAPCTFITGNDTAAGAIAQGPANTQNIYDVRIANLRIGDTSSSNSGSVAIDLPGLTYSEIDNIQVANVATGIVVGGPGGECACYDSFFQNFISAGFRGIDLEGVANQDISFGGGYSAPTGIYIDANAGHDSFYSPDLENNSTYAADIFGNENLIDTPYMEGSGPVHLESGAASNVFFGPGGSNSQVSDNSGLNSNVILAFGGSGGGLGQTPIHWNVAQMIAWGTDWGLGLNESILLSDQSAAFGNGFGLQILMNGSSQSNFGLFGSGPLEIGALKVHSGEAVTGQIVTSRLSTPSAPVITNVGTPGSTTYTYFVVCKDRQGGVTLPSSSGVTTTGNASLSASNYNLITETLEDGCYQWDILDGNTTTSLAINQKPTGPLQTGNTTWTFKDTGGGTSAYTALTRNTTGDIHLSQSGVLVLGTGCSTIASLPTGTGITDGTLACVNNWNGTAGACLGVTGGSLETLAVYNNTASAWDCP